MKDVSIDTLDRPRTRTAPNPKFSCEIPNTHSILERILDFFLAECFFFGVFPVSSLVWNKGVIPGLVPGTITIPGAIPGSAKANDTKPIFENPLHSGEKINIDGNGVSGLNWSQMALVKWWCTGSGTYSNPYFIDGLEIDGGGSGSGILINNSKNDYFIEICNLST